MLVNMLQTYSKRNIKELHEHDNVPDLVNEMILAKNIKFNIIHSHIMTKRVYL